MTNTSDEMNLQSKQDIICHVEKVKPATSAHYVVDVIPFLAFSAHTKEKVITRTSTFKFLVRKQSHYAHYGADVIPLLAYVIFPSNPTL